MMFRSLLLAGVLCGAVAAAAFPAVAAGLPTHGLDLYGELKYPPDFTHFDYADPTAPKGGEIKLASRASFDTLNPFTLKGQAAPGAGYLFQTLMTSSQDEAFAEYGQIAKEVMVAADHGSVTFKLRREARFSDGSPLTAADVVFSFNTLMKHGHPSFRAYYGHVKEAKAEDDHTITFVFDVKDNRELPLIVGQIPVLSRKDWEGKDFEKTTLKAPLGSGPYIVKSVDPGRRIVYERVKNWWAADLPVNKGQYNFDTITFDVYRDETVLLQALFAGAYDARVENIAKSWESEYKQKPVEDGLIVKQEIKHNIPTGMQAFAYNLRRPVFQDIRVRKALNYAFDFEWSNKQLAFGKYKRNNSFFENAELAAHDLPTAEELKILEPFRGQVPDEVFTTVYKNPETSGKGTDLRANLSVARKLLEDAGYKPGKAGMLEKDGQPLSFEILVNSPAFERWINPYIANLKRLGVAARLRIIDPAQYENRMKTFDFDMTIEVFGQSLSPGNEQRDYWGSDKADIEGSRNIIGIKNPVIDQLIEGIVTAKSRGDLVAHVRALDRVLLWNYYVIPQWYIDYHRVAYWDKFGRPAIEPKYGLSLPETWWYDAVKADKIAAKVKPAGK